MKTKVLPAVLSMKGQSMHGNQRWRVWRQDDNGNRFLIARDLPQEEASKMVQELERRGHKQVYWSEQDTEEPNETAKVGIMRDPEPIKLTDGQTLLVVVRDGRVAEYTWDMGLPHVEFVKRRFGELPAGAWVGTVSKIGGDVVAISSKYFYGYQLPAPEPVMAVVRALFK
jgi:hypothetical protein